jgi:hypothetical protein
MARDPFDVVKQFDKLPNDAIISPRPAAIILNTTDRQLRRKPPIPRRQISQRNVGFRVGDIRALIRNATSLTQPA